MKSNQNMFSLPRRPHLWITVCLLGLASVAALRSAHATTFPASDFNHDGHPDYVLYDFPNNAKTHPTKTAIWYLNDKTFLSGSLGPAVPAGWEVAGVAEAISLRSPGGTAVLDDGVHSFAPTRE